ncbi:hypothetical protein RF11_02788 [Thelohanellus kitauei]|uniref:Uncharacterized protein n=1 Tax=Thelohanellus kitauei TaxID=669202 RepID=A0A0C2IWZ2_THEKT|nr:hypothetical protein RF11_02788 [Thelohanellus kitauei]
MNYHHIFLAIIKDVISYCNHYIIMNTLHEDFTMLYLQMMYIENGQSYYFKVFYEDGILYLRINYIFDDVNVNVTIDTVSLETVSHVIEMFQNCFVSLMLDDGDGDDSEFHMCSRDVRRNHYTPRGSDLSHIILDRGHDT